MTCWLRDGLFGRSCFLVVDVFAILRRSFVESWWRSFARVSWAWAWEVGGWRLPFLFVLFFSLSGVVLEVFKLCSLRRLVAT